MSMDQARTPLRLAVKRGVLCVVMLQIRMRQMLSLNCKSILGPGFELISSKTMNFAPKKTKSTQS